MREVLHCLWATGAIRTIPGRLGVTRTLTRPLAFDAPVTIPSVEPLIRTRMPCTALPAWLSFIVSVVFRPTYSVFGAMTTAVHACGFLTVGGTKGPLT